ncbi:(2Fe-2S)-binding protein [Candidatus Babeliales bacterium]|nr:(2Fe-2S)-binding protein [Candidatus Babeliales bacterium]
MSCCKKNNGCQQNNVSDYLVCTCMGVMRSEIVEAIEQGSRDFDALSEKLGVGTGCSSCVQEVHDILKQTLGSGCCKT